MNECCIKRGFKEICVVGPFIKLHPILPQAHLYFSTIRVVQKAFACTKFQEIGIYCKAGAGRRVTGGLAV